MASLALLGLAKTRQRSRISHYPKHSAGGDLSNFYFPFKQTVSVQRSLQSPGRTLNPGQPSPFGLPPPNKSAALHGEVGKPVLERSRGAGCVWVISRALWRNRKAEGLGVFCWHTLWSTHMDASIGSMLSEHSRPGPLSLVPCSRRGRYRSNKRDEARSLGGELWCSEVAPFSGAVCFSFRMAICPKNC